MKYLCLIYDGEKQWDALSKTEQDAELAEYVAFTDAIQVASWIPSARWGSIEVRPIQEFKE